MKWKIIYNPYQDFSFTDFKEKKIVLRRPLDLIHEILHVVIHPCGLGKEEEEIIVSFLSENIELFLIEDLGLDINLPFLFV